MTYPSRQYRTEEYRAKERARYQRTKEARQEAARRSYYKNHDKQLERFRKRRLVATSINIIRNDPDAVYREISRAVPSGLPPHMRGDVIAEMCLAVLEGQLLVRDAAARVREYVRGYNRQYDGFKTISLDAGTVDFTLGEKLGIY